MNYQKSHSPIFQCHSILWLSWEQVSLKTSSYQLRTDYQFPLRFQCSAVTFVSNFFFLLQYSLEYFFFKMLFYVFSRAFTHKTVKSINFNRRMFKIVTNLSFHAEKLFCQILYIPICKQVSGCCQWENLEAEKFTSMYPRGMQYILKFAFRPCWIIISTINFSEAWNVSYQTLIGF